MAEIELSVLARQCLDRRIETREELEREVAAWEEERNERQVGVRWRFTTADARINFGISTQQFKPVDPLAAALENS